MLIELFVRRQARRAILSIGFKCVLAGCSIPIGMVESVSAAPKPRADSLLTPIVIEQRPGFGIGNRIGTHNGTGVGPGVTGPLTIVVSLRSQRLTAYDASGLLLRSPISSGQKGFETPQGVFSIIERNREHVSNLYDDAPMPNMQRITWSGVALHAGRLPGYPASHGCIRLPLDVSARLFDLTKLGTRVVVAQDDVEPVPFAHPKLFTVHLDDDHPALAGADDVQSMAKASTGLSVPMMLGAAIASPVHAKALPPSIGGSRATPDPFAELPVGTSRPVWVAHLFDVARSHETLATKAKSDAAVAARVLQASQAKLRALENDRSALSAKYDKSAALLSAPMAVSRRANLDRGQIKIAHRLVDLLAQTDRQRAVLQGARSNVERLHDVVATTATARIASLSRARDANRRTKPVSVFVSRKSGRLYVRQGFEPLFDVLIDIDDQPSAIGTHIYTAVGSDASARTVQWSVVSPIDGRASATVPTVADEMGRASNTRLNPSAALDRLTIPDNVRRRVGALLIPGSSLIISDEAISAETGKGTDFVVLTK